MTYSVADGARAPPVEYHGLPDRRRWALLATYTSDCQGTPVKVVGTDPTSTSTRYYYVDNAHGDVVDLVDASGNPVASYAYDTWGALIGVSESVANGWSNPYRYDGCDGVRYDVAQGLYEVAPQAYNRR